MGLGWCVAIHVCVFGGLHGAVRKFPDGDAVATKCTNAQTNAQTNVKWSNAVENKCTNAQTNAQTIAKWSNAQTPKWSNAHLDG